MKRLTWMVCALALAACAKADTAADTAAAMAAAPPPPAPIQLSDVAGTWAVKGMNASDSVIVTYDLVTTADTAGWLITFPNGQKVPMRVASVAGDSIVVIAGPFPSVLRKGVRVTTDGTYRLQDGKLVGTTIARYDVKTADSVATIRMEGTRKP